MSSDWMPTVRIPMSREAFDQLPRNPAYRYEHLGGEALLSPRPKHYHASCRLERSSIPPAANCRPACDADIGALVPLFEACFRHIQPFGSLDGPTRERAARHSLERTYTGGDGPLIEPASFVTTERDALCGCILITLLPDGDSCDVASYQWRESPPADCIERRIGRPHLTWIFVDPQRAGQGIGSGLLSMTANSLLQLGYTELLSTFMIGNHSSMLWHWRNGFRLLSHPQSMRRAQRQELAT
jgi:GNAT superfamily N-acetyltransferase